MAEISHRKSIAPFALMHPGLPLLWCCFWDVNSTEMFVIVGGSLDRSCGVRSYDTCTSTAAAAVVDSTSS